MQLQTDLTRCLSAVQQLLRHELGHKEIMCLTARLLQRERFILRQIRQVEETDKIARSAARNHLAQVDRNLRDDRLIHAFAVLVVKGTAEHRREHGQRADTQLLCNRMQLRKRERNIGYDLCHIAEVGQPLCMHSLRLLINAVRLRLHLLQSTERIFTLLAGVHGIQRADAAVIPDRLAAFLQIQEQHAADKFFKASAVADAVLIFHVNIVAAVADEEQIMVCIRRTDGISVLYPRRIKRQNNRILAVNIALIRSFGLFNADAHMRETQQRNAYCLEQAFRVNRLAHADGMAWHARHGGFCIIKKNFSIAIRHCQRIDS